MHRLALSITLFLFPPLFAQVVNLPSSKRLSHPPLGRLASLNGFTPTVALSPDGRYAAFLHDGYGTQQSQAHQSIGVLNLISNELTDFPEDRLPEEARQSYFLGLVFGSDGTHLYASVGSITDPSGEKAGDLGNGIAIYNFQAGKISPDRFIKIPLQKIAAGKKVAHELSKVPPGTAIPYPAGLAIVVGHPDRLLVANNYSDNVVLMDSSDGHPLQSFDLSTGDFIPNSYPHSVVVSRDGLRAWCSLWNSSSVAELDLTSGKVVRTIPLLEPKDLSAPGTHPAAMLLSPDGQRLYVALANADKVAVIATDSGESFTLDTNLAGQRYGGTVPSALAISADGKRLFVADAALNAVAIFDTSNPAVNKPIGFFPTDWYPTALATVGSDLLIATSKGQGTGPNNGISQLKNERRHRDHPYIPTLLYGSIARVQIAEVEKRLPELTRTVEEANLLRADPGKFLFPGSGNPIRHVIYIIKENRTYDQILGDLKAGDRRIGNGDSSLTMYGADVTPNEHKLALQFGVLDNFYDSGEVSGDGHEWSTAAITSDYNENTWQIGYRSRERSYDYQGAVAEETPFDQNRPDVDAPATGYIWDNAAAHGLSYRDYGEFINAVWCKPESVASPQEGTPSPLKAQCPIVSITQGQPLPHNLGSPAGSTSPWPWQVPMLKEGKPTKTVLRDHFDPNFPDFNTDYPDQLRADEFLNEFGGFVTALHGKDKSAELPQFVLLYLPDDHTGGTRPGKPRPAASVADNDLAVGRVVDAVSHSPYWSDTAIFIVEDDAQDGADHVDAHRSIAFAISKYSPGSASHPFVDSRFYTTVNMMHTMESLLGLPPMNQNDGYAPLMTSLFSGKGQQPPFAADFSNRDDGLIYQVNPSKGRDAKESSRLDFSRPDANNAVLLNGILWHDRKGNLPIPAAKHTVFPNGPSADKD